MSHMIINKSLTMSSSERLLQPLWDHILRNYGYVVSYWLFPALVGFGTFVVTGIYFSLKDVGPWRSEAARLYGKDCMPTWKEVLRVGGFQIGVYTAINTLMWFASPHHIELPEEAPTVWELVRDLSISIVIGDFLQYWDHRMFHTPFLYKHAHYLHHRFKGDVFGFAGGWVHPLEIAAFATCALTYPVKICPVHPLTLWIHVFIYVALLMEEHSGQDVWWSPYHLVPGVLGGGVPHTLHHTKVKTNYGNIFAIWDRIFGTYEAFDPKKIKG